MSIAHAEFQHKLTKDLDALREEVKDVVMSAERAFPTLPLHVYDDIRHSSIHLFVYGHPRLVTMIKVRLLYRDWKLVGRIRISEEVKVRPTVPMENRNMWVSVASPAHNTYEPLSARALGPTWHTPSVQGHHGAAVASQWARYRSAHRHGVGLPYGHTAAHVAALAHEQRGSDEPTPSPTKSPYETQAQYNARKRRNWTVRNLERRRAAILSVQQAVEEEHQKSRRTTRKQKGPK